MLTQEKVKIVKILEQSEDAIWIETNGGSRRAVVYRSLHPTISIGDWVIVNTTATALGLGTGGWDIVRAVITEEASLWKEKRHGHIMKGRYLSDQHSVLSVEAPESSYHSLFQKKFSLDGKKILLCELHSMIPIIWFLLQQMEEPIPLTVIFSDEASLPLQMSRHLSYLKKQSQFISITTGQSFGGQLEAINIVSALQYIIETNSGGMVLISQGPGVTGSNTYYGFTSLAQSNWANMVGALGGKPVWIPRMSQADGRERHQGISHHTITPLGELTLTKSIMPVPTGKYSDPWIQNDMESLKAKEHVEIRKVNEELLFPLLSKVQGCSPFPITTMGRTIDKDPLFFLGVSAAVQWYLDDCDHSFNV
ncbi:MAG: DUF3866 family protein [Bacillus sp. (in: Bacteria)]|nr:DUF3866 family protein [Bacillus sp. (in: firmicutes)]